VLACVLREVLKSHGEDRALLLTDGIEEMCVGEMNQTRCRYRQNVTIEQYNKNIAGKTGVLFAAACRLGAMEVTEDPKIAEEYEQLGRKLGRAFQLRDDLLDITSDAKAAGKLVMQDFREGIYTLPVLLARDHTTFGPVVRTLMKKSRKGILREEDLEALKEALLKSRAIDRVSQEIRGLLEECRHAAGHSSCLWAKKRTEAILDRLKTMEGCRASDIQGAVVKK
jgi:heptaprenyl diphosphate synthase